MGKKYLDTKQSTIEASVLDVWADSAEEQKAIRSAARMVVDDTMGEQLMGPKATAAAQKKWEKDRKKREAAQEKADKEAKAAAKAAADDKSPPADALPKVPSGSDFLPGGPKRKPPGQAIVIAPADVKAKIAKADAASGGEYDAAAQTSAQAAANAAQAAANVKAAADAITTAVKHDKKPAAGPTVDIRKLPQVAAPKAEPWVDPDKGKKAKAKVDPATQVQPGHRDYKQNPDKTYGPRHKWSRGKYAGSDDPRFSSDPRAGRGEPQVAHYQHELAVHEAIRDAANRMISEMEDPRGGGASGAIKTKRARDAERKRLGLDKPVPKFKGPTDAPGAAAPVGRVDVEPLPGGPTGDQGEPVPGQGAARPKPKTKTRPVMTRKAYAATKYGGGETQRPMKQKQQDAEKSGGGPEIEIKSKKPTKPKTGNPMAPAGPGELGTRRPATTPTKVTPTKVTPTRAVTKPKVPAGLSTRKITRPGAKKTSSYIANVKGSKSSDPRAGGVEPVVGHYQPEDGDYMKEWHDKKTGRNRKVHRGDDRKVNEVTGDKEEYTKFFNSAMKKFGVTSPDQLKGDKQKEFYDYVDANWEGDDEKAEQVVRDFKVNSMRETLRQMWSQQNEEGSKDEVVNKSRKKTDTGGKPAVIDTKPKTGNPHY